MAEIPPMTPAAQEAYAEALRRIAECQKSGKAAAVLDLKRLGLTTLPPEIGQLRALTEFNLEYNKLRTLPPEIGQLTALKELRLYNNHLNTLPPEIGQLTELTILDLSNNMLCKLPSEIGQLTALRMLSLHNNHLNLLPSEIGQLTALTMLSLHNNNLLTLPQEIAQLTALKTLYLHGNVVLGLPPEVLGPRWVDSYENKTPAAPHEILYYYFVHRQAVEDEGTEALMEAKVLVLGEASVGKSCLISALTQGRRRTELDGKGTSGIVRQLWEVPVMGSEMAPKPKAPGVETLRLNCWDFGGQEIYHSAHTLFLTTRAVYLIVLSKRDNERQNNVDYWLRMAASFGGPDAVVYVVVNKCDEKVGHPPDEQALRLRHPHLRGFLYTSCDTLTGIGEARIVVVREALRLVGVRTPVAKTWLAVKKKLEKMPEHTLSMVEWAQLCGSKISTPEARRELLHLCDRLGTVRYFPTTKEQMVDACETAILNPEWVTLGIYALLDDAATQKRGGLLDRTQMTAILKQRGYPSAHEKIIEEVMRRFDLLYDSAEHGPMHRMLIPLMLRERMPEFAWPQAGTLEFVYQYEVMPAGLLPAFMARQHGNLDATVPNWRHGCVLELKQCRVRVIADMELRRVMISVSGEEALRREALDQVRHTFEALHGTVENLPVQELIPVPGRPDAPMLDYSLLRSLSWNGIAKHNVSGTRPGEILRIDVEEALNGVRGTEQRKQDEEQRQRGGDIHNHFHGDNPKVSNSMNTDSHNLTIHGNVTNAQVGQTLTNCTNTINEQPAGERRDLLQELTKQVEALIQQLPPDKAKEAPKVANKLNQLITQATSPEPEREWYDISAKGLLEAAKWVHDFAGNITGNVEKLGKLLGF
ncbi:COR domain-containing protein [Prosthecobacter sp.]|uniref:COR domain-containing protein n=1 Tax=Prosthecobacter sp. TaxID=1965333 RepID=UPI003784D21A